MAADVFKFIRGWRRLYPRLARSPFWLAGESYAGERRHWEAETWSGGEAGRQAASAGRALPCAAACTLLHLHPVRPSCLPPHSYTSHPCHTGHYVPHLALKLLEHNAGLAAGSAERIDFRGFLLGALCAAGHAALRCWVRA